MKPIMQPVNPERPNCVICESEEISIVWANKGLTLMRVHVLNLYSSHPIFY